MRAITGSRNTLLEIMMLTNALKRSTPVVAAALVASAGLTAPTLAQCHLSIDATPLVVNTGEQVRVHVRAHFAATDYAWASAQFDVTATEPQWTFASAGALAWSDVLGINVFQHHQPQLGVLADPANPKRIWTGVFRPTTFAPALVTFEAVPADFWVYPSPLTSSSAPCAATGGTDQVFVNPLTIGAAAAAPARGTSLDAVGDAFVATPQSPEPAILIGLLLPAVQKVREASARVNFDDVPDRLKVEADLPSHSDLPMDSFSLNFEKIRTTSMYEVDTRLPLGVRLSYQFSLGGVPVARKDALAGPAPFKIEGLPDVVGLRWEPLRPASGLRPSRGSVETAVLSYDVPVRFYLDAGGMMLADTVEVRMTSANNLKQIGLAILNLEAHGAGVMKVTPRQE